MANEINNDSGNKSSKFYDTRSNFKFFDAQHMINTELIRQEVGKLKINFMGELKQHELERNLPAVYSEALLRDSE